MATYEIDGIDYELPDDITEEQLAGVVAELTGTQEPGFAGAEPTFGAVPEVVEMGRQAREQTGPAALETLGTVGSAVLAEPASGIAGLATTAVAGPEAGAEAVEATQQALTFDPVSEQGRQNIQQLSQTLRPVADILQRAERASGDLGFDLAGPVGGAIMASLPTATLEALGLTGLVGGRRAVGALNEGARRSAQRVEDLARRAEIDLIDDAGVVTDQAIDFIENQIRTQALGPDDIENITEGLQQIGVLSPDQLRRAQVFQRRGVTPLRANLTQATDDFRDLQDAVKRSGPVADVVSEQDFQLAQAVSEGIEQIGPSSGDIVQTNSNLFQSVDNVVSSLDRVVDEAYRAARESAPTARNVRYDNLSKALRDSVGLQNASGGIPSALRQELRNRGILTPQGGFDPVGLTDVRTAEEVRQFLNSLFDPQQPRGNQLLRELKSALDEDVSNAVGRDIFAPARAAKQRVETIISRGQRNRRDKTKGSFLEDVVNNKIPEEKIFQRLMSGRDDDFLKFKQFLLEDAGESGFQTWQDIKAQTLRNALDKATSTQGKGEGGQAVFNSRLFANEFKNLRNTRKFDELFTPDEQQLIDDIVDIGSLRVPQRPVQAGSGPSGFAVETVRQAIVDRIPVAREARELMESVRARDADVRQLDPFTQTEREIRGR